jgi:DNA repair protein RecO (recombination protein O)
MSIERATGLVVRGVDWSETSRIATLFTREFGKIRVLAKGGRRLNSNFEIALDLLGVCDILFIRKAHGGLDLLTEARITERFSTLRADLHALYAGYYLSELLADGTQDYDPHPALFDEALNALRTLTPGGDPLPVITRFELVWLQELGYTPRLDACASCGTDGPSAMPNGRFLVGPTAGGWLCPKCRLAGGDARSLSADAFQAFLGMVERTIELPVDVRTELRPLLGMMVCVVLGRRPKLSPYVDGG